MLQLKSEGFCLYLLSLFFWSAITISAFSQELLTNETARYEYRSDCGYLSLLPMLGVFCVQQYPAQIEECQYAMTLFTQIGILDLCYQSSHDGRLWHDIIHWTSFLIISIAGNPRFEFGRFPDLREVLEVVIVIRTLEIGADTGARLLGYWPQNVNKNRYAQFRNVINSVSTGIVISSLLLLKMKVAICQRFIMPLLSSLFVMALSVEVEVEKIGEEILFGALLNVALTFIVIGGGAIFEAETGVLVIAGAGAAVAALAGALGGALAGAVAGAVTGAMAVTEPGAGAVAASVAVAVAVFATGLLLVMAISSIVRLRLDNQGNIWFDIQNNALLSNLWRLGGLLAISQASSLLLQIVSDFNSGTPFTDTVAKQMETFCYGFYRNIAAYILFFWGMLIIVE